MEQQKILWIVLSVAVLLLAVLGTVLFVFGPLSQDGAAGKMASGKVESAGAFDPVEWARTESEYPALSEDENAQEAEEEFVVVYGEGVGKDEIPLPGTEAAQGKGDAEVVSLAVKKADTAPVAVPALVAAAPAVKQTPAPVQKKAAAPVAKPAPAPVLKKAVEEYWIQAGSFSSTTRAEEARKLLVSKGFPATLQTKSVDGKDFYRVRIGSYPAKEEAEKFLYWIKEIDGFSQSYISQVKAER